MQETKGCCSANLRVKCFIIGYLHLVACVVDIGFHVLIAAIVSSGFQCDVGTESLELINWPWLEPLLFVINLGTHGFYPFPLVLRASSSQVEYMPISSQPKCYPGMLHLYLIDILNFLINVIWLKFVVNYVSALHRKDPEPMHMFFSLSMVKLVLQLMYIAYQPDFRNTVPLEAYWIVKLLDVCIAAFFLYLINKYTREIKMEKETENYMPSYIDTLIASSQKPTQDEKKDGDAVLSILSILEEKPTELTKDKPNVI